MSRLAVIVSLLLVTQPAFAAQPPAALAEALPFSVDDFGSLTQSDLDAKYKGQSVSLSGELLGVGRDNERGSDYYNVRLRKPGAVGAVVARVYFADPFAEQVRTLRRQANQKSASEVAIRGICQGVIVDDKGGGIVILRRSDVASH